MKYDNDKILEILAQDLPTREIHNKVFKETYVLVNRLTRKYRKHNSYKDITQEGYRALFRAITTFDKEVCPNFYGWAFLYVKPTVARAALKHKQYSERFKLTANAHKLLEDEAAGDTPEDILFNIEMVLLVENASKRLGKQTNYIINKLFGIGSLGQETILELENTSKLSRHRIRKIRDMGLQQLRADKQLLEALK